MNVFQRHRKIEITGFNPVENILQSMDYGFGIGHRDNALLAQHPGMGDGTADILVVEPLIELYGSGEFLYEFIGRLGEATAPQFIL
jgi:hypothetical protein